MEQLDQLQFSHPAWIEVDLQQFKQNIRAIKQYIGQCKFCLPIKANAYGHGLIPIAKAAVEENIDYLGVSCLQEGALLRDAGIQIPILVMGAIHEQQIEELLNYQLEFTISSLYKAKITAEKCIQLQQKGKVHVEVDTGMQRTGVRPDSAIDLLNYLYSMKCFEVVGLYSHLATGDSPNNDIAKDQIRVFQQFTKQYTSKQGKNILCHLSNSGGVCYYPEAHMDMVRPGLLAFGYFPRSSNKLLQTIEPFFSIKAKISYFKVVGKNQGISYGHTYITNKETRIVTVPVGYGDGFRRALSNCGEIIIRDKRYPIIGTICMDQFMVDIDHNEAYVGDVVTLIGKENKTQITLEEIANLCDTIPYEILCGFNDRLPRFYK